MPSLRPAATKREEVIAVYSDPASYLLAEVLIRGALKIGPDDARYGRNLTCFLVDLESKVYTNRLEAQKANRDKNLWDLKRRLVHKMTGEDLLAMLPPGEDTVRKWRQRVLPPSTVTKDDAKLPEPLRLFSRAFTEAAVARARELGQFTPGRARNFTLTDLAHAIIADGTYKKPFSNARTVLFPGGKEKVLGSRGKNKAIIQDAVTRAAKDNRTFMGVNHVVAITRTRYGRVVLAAQRATHGEPSAAVDLVESVVEHAGDGVHTLVYDKGLETWPVEYLMAQHGILAVRPPKADKKNDAETQQAKLDATAALQRAMVQQKAAAKKSARTNRGSKP